jgi:uncharacterized protein
MKSIVSEIRYVTRECCACNDAELPRIVHCSALANCFASEFGCPPFQLFFDDANSPSLLSLPHIGYMEQDNPLYRATRHFILSDGNPFFFRGSAGEGIGSPHVPWRFVWPMSIVMRALTSSSDHEIAQCLTTLRDTTAGNLTAPHVIGCDLPSA